MATGTLSGRYELGDRLGSGGMSNVYRATDRILERTVAVKILAEHLSDDERFVARFRREALAVAKLIHPNIVQVYDTGVDEGRHYIVMEYVEGRSGAQMLQRQGPIDSETAAEIGIQACAGLDYAHRRGIIHRDVKPGNLMIVGGPVGRRPDDGQADRLRDRPGARADPDHPGRLGGRHRRIPGARSRSAARRRRRRPTSTRSASSSTSSSPAACPTRARASPSCAVRQQNERPLPPRTYNDEVPETLGGAVLRALEGDPARRYASADELARGLRLGLQGEDVTLPLGGGDDARPASSAARPRRGASTATERTRVPARRRRRGPARRRQSGAAAGRRRRRRGAAPSPASCAAVMALDRPGADRRRRRRAP